MSLVWNLLFIVLLLQSAKASANQYKYELLNENDGFSTSIIFSIVQDNNGFIWFGTAYNGLMRYDGKNVVTFNNQPNNENSLPYDNAGNLLFDKTNKLWIGSWGGGVISYDVDIQQFKLYQHSDNSNAISSSKVQSILEDEHGDIWFGPTFGGLNKYNKATDDFTQYPLVDESGKSIAAPRIWDIKQVKADQLWLGTDSGLFLFQPSSGEYTSYIPDHNETALYSKRIRAMVPGTKGQLFLGTQDGMVSFNNEDYTFSPIPVDGFANIGPVYSIIKTDFQQYWLSSGQGVFSFSEDDLTLRKVPLGFDDRCSQSLFQDKQSVLWVSCEGVGVYKVVRENTFSVFSDPRVKATFSIYASDDGSILIGTSQNGLFRWVPKTNTVMQVYRNSELNTQPEIYFIKQSKRGDIWFASRKRLFKIDSTEKAIEVELPANVRLVSDLEIDVNDNVWISTNHGFYIISNDDKKLVPVTTKQSTLGIGEDSASRRVFRDNENRMWLADRNLLYLWDVKTQLANYVLYFNFTLPKSIGEHVIYQLYQDSKKRIWISTSGGLFIFNESAKEYRLYSHYFNESQNRGARFITEDKAGILWLMTPLGITSLNVDSGVIQDFDSKDGLSGSRYFYEPTLNKDGTIYLSNRDGIYYFNPLNVENDKLDEPTYLVNFEVLGSSQLFKPSVLQNKGVSLDYDETNIRFEFVTLDLLNAKQIEYRYKLEGFDSDWISIGNTNRATYTNLSGGEYVFRVSAGLKNNLKYEQELAIDLRIATPIWERWWMFIVYAGLIIISFFYYVWRQKQALIDLEGQVAQKTASIAAKSKKLELANNIKSQFLANMSHEIRTPLTTVIGQAEAIICRDIEPTNIYKEVEVIHDSSLYLLALLNDILDLTQIEQNKLALDYAPYDLHELLTTLDMMFSLKAKVKGLTFTLTDNLPRPFIVNADGLRLKQILINLCSNAVKFTLKGHVSVEVLVEGGKLIFKVQDTGIGIDKEQLHQIFASFTQGDSSIRRRFGGSGLGLHLSNELASLMHGTIDVSSELNKGSLFTFSMPIEVILNESAHTEINAIMNTAEQKPIFTGKILLADDHDDNRRLMTRLLTKLGLTVYVAKDGLEALELYSKHRPQVIMLDIQMPNMDGIQAYKLLRELGCKDAIIAFTANAMTSEVEEYLHLGFDSVIQKPVDRSQLITSLAKYFESHKGVEQSDAISLLKNIDMSDLITKFKTSLVNEQEKMNQLWRNQDFEQLSMQAHSISGAANLFGFPILSVKAATLEASLRVNSDNLAQVKVDVDALLAEITTIAAN